MLHGFTAPHILEISPDGDHAYVTDDAQGTLSVIRLSDDRLTSTIHVGAQAHHMASSPDQRRLWIALGESARTIAIVDTSDVERPKLIGDFDPGFPAHDLAFSPDGRQVWVSSDTYGEVAVFRARDRRLLFRVPVGRPPQHVAFAGGYAYLARRFAHLAGLGRPAGTNELAAELKLHPSGVRVQLERLHTAGLVARERVRQAMGCPSGAPDAIRARGPRPGGVPDRGRRLQTNLAGLPRPTREKRHLVYTSLGV